MHAAPIGRQRANRIAEVNRSPIISHGICAWPINGMLAPITGGPMKRPAAERDDIRLTACRSEIQRLHVALGELAMNGELDVSDLARLLRRGPTPSG